MTNETTNLSIPARRLIAMIALLVGVTMAAAPTLAQVTPQKPIQRPVLSFTPVGAFPRA